MQLGILSRRLVPLALLIIGVIGGASPARAVAGPLLFGPQGYTRSDAAAPDSFSDTFDVPVGLNGVVWIQNGDGDGSRTASATVSINGTTIAGPADFNKPIDLIAKAVTLPKGEATLGVELTGEAGSVITIVVMVQGNRPDVTVGRLLVPYASGSGLTIALKNGARHRREVKVVFYDDGGNVVATSNRLVLPPHGSVSKSAADLITEGAFAAGSIEVFWVGFGPGRVFGEATVHDDLTGVDSITEMQHAGYKRIDPLDMSLKFVH